jgi:predicted transposase/invertase (TIGR01784 family)
LSKPLDRWLIFIEESPEEVLEVVLKMEPAIAKAEEILERLGSLDEVRRYYEAREMAIHDEITRITGAKEEGKLEGKMEGKMEIALKLISIGMEMDEIVNITGLTHEQVKRLMN